MPVSRHSLSLDVGLCLRESRCPVCAAAENGLQGFFAWFAIETYADPGLMRRLSRGGFCPDHTVVVEKMGPMVSRTFESVIASRRHRLELILDEAGKMARTRPGWLFLLARKLAMTKALAKIKTSEPCPACESAKGAASFAAYEVAAFLSAETNRSLYASAPTLCWPHLTAVVKVSSPALSLFLAGCHLRQMRIWHTECREYFRKSSYQYRQEPRGPEQYTWLQALRFFCGLK